MAAIIWRPSEITCIAPSAYCSSLLPPLVSECGSWFILSTALFVPSGVSNSRYDLVSCRTGVSINFVQPGPVSQSLCRVRGNMRACYEPYLLMRAVVLTLAGHAETIDSLNLIVRPTRQVGPLYFGMQRQRSPAIRRFSCITQTPAGKRRLVVGQSCAAYQRLPTETSPSASDHSSSFFLPHGQRCSAQPRPGPILPCLVRGIVVVCHELSGSQKTRPVGVKQVGRLPIKIGPCRILSHLSPSALFCWRVSWSDLDMRANLPLFLSRR